jgi:nucleoside-diphosphate-sugar epimerase
VGSHVARQLVEDGHEVLNLDVRQPHEENRDIRWEYVDLKERYQVVHALKGVQVVVHCGELPGLHRAETPDQLFRHNGAASSTLIEVAIEQGVEHFVYTSSAQVYGAWGKPRVETIQLPVTEETPVHPLQAYALGKVAIENYLRAKCERGLLGGSIFRPPYVWRDHPWARQIKEVHEQRDGFCTYVFPDDLARAYSLAVANNLPGCETYNLSAKDIANLVPVKQYIKEAYPQYGQLPEDWPENRSPYLTENTRDKLAWEPKRTLREFQDK